MPVSQYRKKPVVVDAIQFDGDNAQEVAEFLQYAAQGQESTDRIVIATLEGSMEATVGDYVIKGVKGEFYPCKPDIFEVTYEPVSGCRADD